MPNISPATAPLRGRFRLRRDTVFASQHVGPTGHIRILNPLVGVFSAFFGAA